MVCVCVCENQGHFIRLSADLLIFQETASVADMARPMLTNGEGEQGATTSWTELTCQSFLQGQPRTHLTLQLQPGESLRPK